MPATSSSPWSRFLRRLKLPLLQTHSERFLKLAADARSRIQELPPLEAFVAVEKAALLIDVRERGEYAQRHIPGAEPLGRGILDITIERLAPDLETSIILYCSGGNRSAITADTLQRMGYTNIQTIAGGLFAWIEADLPTASEPEALD